MRLQKALDRIADEDHARFIPAFKPSDVCEECVEAIFYGMWNAAKNVERHSNKI